MMNNFIKNILIILFLGIPCISFAIPTITQVRVTNGTCSGNGELEIIVTGAEAPIRYALIEPSPITSPVQESNKFTGLPSGTYTVAVYDKTTGASPVTRVATITNTYPDFSLNPPSASTDTAINCDNGVLRISVNGGRAPYNYIVTNTTTNQTWKQTSNSTNYNLSGLPSGEYHAEVTDKCGEYRSTVNTTKVSSPVGELKDTPFNSISITNPYYNGNGSCSRIYMRLYLTNFLINGENTIPSKYYQTLKYRIEYPAGSGNYTAWQTQISTYTYFYINNYDTTNVNYRIQVKHPCSEAITSSDVMQFPIARINYYVINQPAHYDGFCDVPIDARIYLSSTGINNYVCGEYPYTVTFTPTSGIGTQTKTFSWPSGIYSFAQNLDTATTYNVEIVDKNGVVLSGNGLNINIQKQPPLSFYSYLYDYYIDMYQYKCQLNTMGIYILPRYQSYSNYTLKGKVTFSIDSGPETNRAPITKDFDVTPNNFYLWDDLPYGNYQIKMDFDCGRTETFTHNWSQQPYKSHDTTKEAIIVEDGTVCGKYNIKINPQAFNQNNQSVTLSRYSSFLYKKNNDNSKTLINSSSTQYSDTYTFSNITGGSNYVVEIRPYNYYNWYYSNTENRNNYYWWVDPNCTFYTKEISLASYSPPVVNIPLSGGITCTGQATGRLTITSTGDRPPYTYRQKYLDDDDSKYSEWQTSNIFEGVIPAKYAVQVKDNCGSASTQELRVFNGTDQFLTIIGEIAPGVVCSGKSTVLSVLSVGPVISYEWYKDNIKISGENGPTYTINNTSASDIGSYTVKINNGYCDLTSSVAILDVVTSPGKPVLTGVCTTNGGMTMTITSPELDIVAYNWYQDGIAITNATTATYTTNTKGNYHVTIRTSGGCTSASSDTITIADALMYWNQSAVDNNWNNPANWINASGAVANAVPGECTTVHIPGNAMFYPVLSSTSTAICRNIYFHFGAEVAKPQYLTYEKAYIQYNFGFYDSSNNYKTDGDALSATPLKRGQWYALSAPLKNMASGDFAVGGYPNMWQQGFIAKQNGNDWNGTWDTPGRDNALPIGEQYHAISIWAGEYLPDVLGEKDHTNLNALNGILEMPYFENAAVSTLHRTHQYDTTSDESKFMYYDQESPGLDIDEHKTPGVIRRGKGDAYKFVFDNNLTTNNEYKLTVPAGVKMMIGNPVLSSLDFDKFYQINNTKIESHYRLYKDNAWVVYDVNLGSSLLTKEIASYQAFFIETKGNGMTELNFPLDDISITRNTGSAHQLRTASNSHDNVLYIKTENSFGETWVTLSYNNSIIGKDVDQLFSPDYPEIPQMYISNGKIKNALQHVTTEKVDLGLKNSGTSKVKLSIKNLDNFYGTGLNLLDKKLNNSIDLLETEGVYEFTNDPEFQDRFTLTATGLNTLSNIDDIHATQEGIEIYTSGQTLYISSTENISEIRMNSIHGIPVFSAQDPGLQFSKKLNIAQGTYIVTVKCSNGDHKVEKVLIR